MDSLKRVFKEILERDYLKSDSLKRLSSGQPLYRQRSARQIRFRAAICRMARLFDGVFWQAIRVRLVPFSSAGLSRCRFQLDFAWNCNPATAIQRLRSMPVHCVTGAPGAIESLMPFNLCTRMLRLAISVKPRVGLSGPVNG